MNLTANISQPSGEVAKARLKQVIFQDRMQTSPEKLQMLRGDLLQVLQSHLDIDEDELDMHLCATSLNANIPIKGWKK
ncbi:MAG: cell division topological specificity factor MinE [Defluviitaleaceae bacterium]|nr:cell division topological specificity factor MinE [Defluviitaleaceae bacterium]